MVIAESVFYSNQCSSDDSFLSLSRATLPNLGPDKKRQACRP